MDALLILLRHGTKHLQSGMESVKVLAQKRPIVACHASLIDHSPHIEPSVRFISRKIDGEFAAAHRKKYLGKSLSQLALV